MCESAPECSSTKEVERASLRRPAAAWLGVASVMLAACATYEPSSALGGAETSAASGSTFAGSAPVTGGNTGSPIGDMTPAIPKGGMPASGGNTTGGVSAMGGAGSGGIAGTGGGAGAGGGRTGGAGNGSGGACAQCANLKEALVHRYDFEGTGTAVMDRRGTAHGTLQGGATLSTIDGKGAVVLGGGASGAYVNLPNALISTLTNATLEAWVTWAGGDPWQRIFDFGDSTHATPEDNPANGKTYLFLTPMTDPGSGGMPRAVYSLDGGSAAAETRAEGMATMPTTLVHVAVVVDASGDALSLYMNGALTGYQLFSGSLASINDVNAWLGRSQYEADVELSATFHDFRIYDAALTAPQIAASFAAGPDPAFLAE